MMPSRWVAREREIDRLHRALVELEERRAPRPVWAGLRGHAEAVLDDWVVSLELYAEREFTEGV